MIDVTKAQELLLKDPVHLGGERLDLSTAFGRVLSEDLIAPYDHPLFDQSAVDGYAMRFEDLGSPLECIGEAAAGSPASEAVTSGKCARIFTGGLMPEGANTVVMQEFTEREGDLLTINDAGLKMGGNVRYKGEQIDKGSLALKAGTCIDAAAIGFLASLGINDLLASKRPRVASVITGSEFIDLGSEALPGMKFSSNGPMLQTCLKQLGLTGTLQNAKDDSMVLREIFSKAIEENDVTIITGGVSVGDHDYTRPVLDELGCEIVFHKVAQKPGKPILFARKGSQYVFGLPGNPRAVFVGFWTYVYPVLNALQGNATPFLKKIEMPMRHNYSKKGQRVELLSAHFAKGTVEVLKGQNSHMLMSLIGADGLMMVPKETEELKAGDMVEVLLLP